MSASHQIASKLVQHREPTLRANRVLTRRNKKAPLFDHLVGAAEQGPNDQEAPPCRDQTRKRIDPVHPLAAPSWTAPANHRLSPTESRFVRSLNESFATQSEAKRTWSGYQDSLPPLRPLAIDARNRAAHD